MEKAISLFDEGQQWEKAIELCDCLIEQHRDVRLDYLAVAKLLETQARLYRNLVSTERFLPDYFRVGFYGKGFPTNYCGKEYIYCGQQLERLQDFVQRIQSRFPEAVLMKSTDPPPAEILNDSGQHLQIFTVSHLADESGEEKKMPENLRLYHQLRHASKFLYKRPFSKSKAKKKENEFLDLWTTNYTYHVDESFPTISARSLISRTETLEVTPVENAVDTIVTKNQELSRLSSLYGSGTHDNISPFTMVLSGTIDACVAGGVEMYKKAFLTEAYLNENPEHKEYVEQLKKLLGEQMMLLSKCIIVHARLCPPSMKQLQDHLEIKLEELNDKWSGKKRVEPKKATLETSNFASSPSLARKSPKLSRNVSTAAPVRSGFAASTPASLSPQAGFVKASSFSGRSRASPMLMGSRRDLLAGNRRAASPTSEGDDETKDE